MNVVQHSSIHLLHIFYKSCHGPCIVYKLLTIMKDTFYNSIYNVNEWTFDVFAQIAGLKS